MTQKDPLDPLNKWIKDIYLYQGKHERMEWEPPLRGNKYKKELFITKEYNNGDEKYSRWVNRLDDSEGHVSKLKYRVVEITQFEHLKGKK